jgi:uncharacterized pyridoxal phosphate-containing UPF0001 family protein
MNNIGENILSVKNELNEGVRLVAVSKFHPVEDLQSAYEAGQRIFGESHAQELVAKEAVLPKDIEWHFIGHLQTNKIKYIAPFISLIHSVDSLKLLKEIDKHAKKSVMPHLMPRRWGMWGGIPGQGSAPAPRGQTAHAGGSRAQRGRFF